MKRWWRQWRKAWQAAREADEEQRLFAEASEIGIRVVRSLLSDFHDWRPTSHLCTYDLENPKLNLYLHWIRNAPHMKLEVHYKGRPVEVLPADAKLIRRAYGKAHAAEQRAWQEAAARELRERTEKALAELRHA